MIGFPYTEKNIVRETDKAFGFAFHKDETEIWWLPKSKIILTEENEDELSDTIVWVPDWLVEKVIGPEQLQKLIEGKYAIIPSKKY